MKRLLALLLLFPAIAWADVNGQAGPTVNGQAGPDINGVAMAVRPSYELQETFDGGSSCGDGSHTNCDNAWTIYAGTWDFNYSTTPAPLQGSYSVLAAGSSEYIVHSLTASDEYYFTIAVNSSNLTQEFDMISLLDASDNILAGFKLYYSYTCTNSGGTNCANTGGLTNEVTYYLKGRAKKGTGSNAEVEVWVSTDGKSGNWGSSRTSTDGTWTTQISKIRVYGRSSITLVYDDLRVSTDDINY